MATPGVSFDLTDPKTPGTPYWWLSRLAQRLLDRQSIYDLREDYANGNHPLPNGDRRYVRALREVQSKAKLNYIELVQSAVTQKMRVKGFRFGEEGFADKDAWRIWQSNDMDYQAPVLIGQAAKLGFCYAVVSAPEQPGDEPVISMRDPRRCEIERDPSRPTKTVAGLEFWADPSSSSVLAILYLPKVTYYFRAVAEKGLDNFVDDLNQGGMSLGINKFQVVRAVPNPLGEVQLVRGDWEPTFGDIGRAEGEGGWDIQDRINKTVLDRLVISNNQAYRQRWVTGAPEPKAAKSGVVKPPWDPGSDMIWMSLDSDTKFGDFAEADIRQILEAVRDDAGDLAATTQTPATYLTNRMVNISGDTIIQANAGHIAKVKLRMDSIGFFFERLEKLAFRYRGDLDKAKDITAQTLWNPPEVNSLANVADAFQKLIASGVPLQLAMEKCGLFSDQEIAWAVQEAERIAQEQMAREEKMLDKQLSAKANQANTPGGSKQ